VAPKIFEFETIDRLAQFLLWEKKESRDEESNQIAASRETARGNGRGMKLGGADGAGDGRDGGLVAQRRGAKWFARLDCN
jgi:hypothetical protein